MTHKEMQEALAEGIDNGTVLGIVRNGELLFFHKDHVGVTVTQEEAKTAITSAQYLELSNADYHAREN